MKRTAARIAIGVLLVDLAAIVVSGGLSLAGPTGVAGFLLRIAATCVLLLWDRRGRDADTGYFYAYVALLLLLLPLLHFRGYRLRGDGLWYYSFTHSLAFDADIGLRNQYQRLGIENASGSAIVRETGKARFTYPVGAPFVWVPFIGLGHLGVALRRLHGLDTPYDGFSDPYFHAVALGNLLFGWAGLLVLDRLLRKWFPPWVAFLAAAGVGLASFLTWYLTYHAIYTHALAFLLVALFLKLWADGLESVKDFAVLGLVLGLLTAVRWQNAVFGLLPAIDLLTKLPRRGLRFAASAGAALGAASLVGVIPQIWTWKTIYDRFYLGVPLGADYVRWNDPFLSEILFSSRHGLFSWSPILLVATVGLVGFVRAHRRVGSPLAALLLILWYVNSTVADWWGGGSYGARRFDSTLPIFALGLATAVEWMTELVRRHARVVTATILATAIGANALLMEQYRKGRIPVDDTMSWQQAAEGGLEDGFDAFGYPFSFPMNWLFALRYDRPKTQYDILVGQYLFHRMGGLDGLIDIGPHDPPFLGNGWSGLTDFGTRVREVRLARGERAGIFVPIDQPESLRIAIDCAVPDGAPPVPVEVLLNGVRLAAFVPTAELAEHVTTADAALWHRINLLELVRLDGDPSVPFLALDRLRFERLR